MIRPKSVSIICAAVLLLAVGRAQNTGPGQRLTPSEIDSISSTDAGAGTWGVGGIQTRVLKGDPNNPGLYTIQLTVPANTKIEAHTHPDDRVATVISGTWQIGYGTAFDEKKLKALEPGSFYTEPPSVAHFARTGNTAVMIQITGYGPTGTTYVAKGQGK
jgi:quercetin dioxygenase-like cupin family protein